MKMLSICIPTYNGENHIGALLTSILEQINDGNREKIEICISDNCSKDDTQTVIFEIMKKYQDVTIKYNRREETCNSAENFVEVVKMSSGLYSNLIGDDDIVLPNMLDFVIRKSEEAEQQGIDVIVSMFDMYNYRTGINFTARILKEYEADKVFEISNRDEFDEYFTHIDGIYGNAAIFAFISNVMFKTEKWLKQSEVLEEKRQSSYMQSYRNIDLLRNNGKLLYLHNSYIYRNQSRDNLIAIHGFEYYYSVCKDMVDLIYYYFDGDLRNTLMNELIPSNIISMFLNPDLDKL